MAGNFPVLRDLRKTPPETCKMAQDHERTVKIFFVINSIRLKCFRHNPYSPDNGPNRYLSFYVKLVTLKLLEIWKQANFCIRNNEDHFKFRWAILQGHLQ